MEQLSFQFIYDEERKKLERKLSYAECCLRMAKEFKQFSYADVAHRQRVVDRIKSEISELP
jgi:hypothetical protein